MIETLIKLEKDGTLKKLVKAGLMPTKVLLYYEVYLEFDKQKKVNKKKTTDIISDLSGRFKVCESTIYLIIKKLK